MPATAYTYRTVQPSTPWAVPTKTSAYASPSRSYQPPHIYGKLSQPPSSRSASITTGGGTYSIPSRASSVSSVGSDSGSESGSPIDALDYMNERLARTVNATSLDRSLAIQAQSSGELNAKTRELQALQALAQSRLQSARRNFDHGLQAAREVQRDLEWTQRKVGTLNRKAAQGYPAHYAAASSRFSELDDE